MTRDRYGPPMSHWLIKSEPDAYSFAQLVHDKTTAWTGVRNYAARNHLRAMKKGDLALFYHSNEGKCVVGVAKIVREAYVEDTDEGDWSVVEIAPVKALKAPVTLEAMREDPALKNMVIWTQNRLSVVPVSKTEFEVIVAAGKKKAGPSAGPPSAPDRARAKRPA